MGTIMRTFRFLFHLILLLLIPLLAHGEPLTMKEAVRRAVAGNPSVAEAQLGVASGEEGVKSAWGKNLPKLTLDANYTRREHPLPYIIDAPLSPSNVHFTDEFASYNIVLTLPLYQGGQTMNGVDLAKVKKDLQRQGLSFTRNEIIANTVNTYNKILQLRKLREASQTSLKALDEQYRNGQLLFGVGRIARVDLLKVEAQLANERQRLISLDAGIATATATLRTLMGEDEAASSEAPIPADTLTQAEVSGDFSSGLETARRQRPEFLSATQGIKEADLNRKLAFGKLLPTVSAFTGYLDQFTLNPSYKEANWYAGFNLSLPLFDRSLYADLSRQRIESERATARLKAVGNQVSLEIRSALNSLEESKARIWAAQQAVAEANEAFRIEQERYKSGAGAVVDLLLAQSADISAAANYSQALYDYNAAAVAYRKATGTLEEYLK